MTVRLFNFVLRVGFLPLPFPTDLSEHLLNLLPFPIHLDKIKKRYGNLGMVLCHTIDRGANTNIGISLAGHRDRNKMACFIAGINPKGVASSSGGLEIGDEILEVNFTPSYSLRCQIIIPPCLGKWSRVTWAMSFKCIGNN